MKNAKADIVQRWELYKQMAAIQYTGKQEE
jgi:hypothetical protein